LLCVYYVGTIQRVEQILVLPKFTRRIYLADSEIDIDGFGLAFLIRYPCPSPIEENRKDVVLDCLGGAVIYTEMSTLKVFCEQVCILSMFGAGMEVVVTRHLLFICEITRGSVP
jgi:hypothetical protein